MSEYNNDYIRNLIKLHILGEVLSQKEKAYLTDWINESEDNKTLFHKIKKELRVGEIKEFLQTDTENAWKTVRKKTFRKYVSVEKEVSAEEETYKEAYKETYKEDKASSLNIKFRWLRYAAVILPIALSFTLWYMWQNKEAYDDKQTVIALNSPILTLDNGKKYQLSQEEENDIVVNKGVKVHQIGGGLIYDTAVDTTENQIKGSKCNSIEVPRGSKYHVVLSDGTRVWLNAATELKYPVTFNKKERRVYLKGEAYFEVTSDKNRPFYVETEDIKVRVLGTAFNINTHHTEGVRTVLVEGAITVKHSNEKEVVMKPGELASFNRNKSELSIKDVNVDSYISWKDGYFVFEDESLEEIMNTLSLWYDKEFFFAEQKGRTLHFTGHLKRYEHIETILSAITEVTGVEFQINGRTIIIR